MMQKVNLTLLDQLCLLLRGHTTVRMTRKVVSEQSSLYGDVLIVLLVVSLSAIVPDVGVCV